MSSASGRRYLFAVSGVRQALSLGGRSHAPVAKAIARHAVSKREFDFDAFDRHGRCPLRWEDVGDVAVVRLGRKQFRDEQQMSVVHDELQRLVGEAGRHQVLLDLAEVEYLSGVSLCAVVRLYKKLRDVHGHLALCNLTPPARDVFKITRLDRLFTVCDGEEQALRTFAL